MDTLTLDVDEKGFLTFTLLINNQPLQKLLQDKNEGFPDWIVDQALPTWPPFDPTAEYRIVTVCGCGEYGCGHSRCKIKEEDDCVVFYDFSGDVGQKGKNMQFTVSRTSYEVVMADIKTWMQKSARK